jgi:hypothetical protein
MSDHAQLQETLQLIYGADFICFPGEMPCATVSVRQERT